MSVENNLCTERAIYLPVFSLKQHKLSRNHNTLKIILTSITIFCAGKGNPKMQDTSYKARK